MHSHVHLFADIIRKGATRTYNTKPSEKAHSPIKVHYQLMTNFKNIVGQVSVIRYFCVLFVAYSHLDRFSSSMKMM